MYFHVKLLAIGLVLACGAGYYGLNSFEHSAGVFAILYLLTLAATVFFCVLFANFVNKRDYKKARWHLTTLFVLAFCLGVFVPCGEFFRQRALTEAFAYPAQMVPLLERYKRANGHYPRSVAELPVGIPTPRLMKDRTYYEHRPKALQFVQGKLKEIEVYWFIFSDPSDDYGHHEFNGITRKWVRVGPDD